MPYRGEKYRFVHEKLRDWITEYMPEWSNPYSFFKQIIDSTLLEQSMRQTGMTVPTAAMVSTLKAAIPFYWNTTDDNFVRRYVVDPDLFNAMLETRPPEEAFEIDELRLPENGIIVRWPNGEESYIITKDRFEEIANDMRGAQAGGPIRLMSESPNAILWLTVAPPRKEDPNTIPKTTPQGFSRTIPAPPVGEMWYGSIDTTKAPVYPGTATELDEIMARDAMVRNLIVYLTTGAALGEAQRTAFKEPASTDAGNRKRRRDRFYNYYYVGSRTREKMRERQEQANAEESAAKEYQFRERVSGHWKRQAFGPGRQMRKWIWIMPYDRPDDPSLPYRPGEETTYVRRMPGGRALPGG